jgi:hypothetical protein
MQIHARIAALRRDYTYEVRVWAGTARGFVLPVLGLNRERNSFFEKCDKASGNETSGALFYAVHTGKTPNQSTRSSDPGFKGG